MYLDEAESAFLALRSGYVFVVSSGNGVLTKISLDMFTKAVDNTGVWDSSNSSAISTGVFFVGEDIAEGQYSFTCTYSTFGMSLVIFEGKDDYVKYFRSSRFTFGEESDAIDANASERKQLYEDNDYSFYLREGNVLMLNGGIGNLERLDDNIADDMQGDNSTIFLYSGLYFIDNDINESRYAFTCIETSFGMSVIVFENRNTYLGYFRTYRSTNGEENAAIEQNALISLYIYEGQTCFLNLNPGMVVLLNNGNGILETAIVNWAP